MRLLALTYAVVLQSKSTEFCSSAAVVPQSKSTEFGSSADVVPQSKSTESVARRPLFYRDMKLGDRCATK